MTTQTEPTEVNTTGSTNVSTNVSTSWSQIVEKSAKIPVTGLRVVDVAINRCYGGFGLSDKAKKRLMELGCKDPDCLDRDNPLLIKVIKELGKEANTPYSNIVLYKGVVDDTRKYWSYSDYDGLESFYSYTREDDAFIKTTILDQKLTPEKKIKMLQEHYAYLEKVRNFILKNNSDF